MQREKFVRIYSLIVAIGVFVLLFAGALVTSTDSGLAVPDWPLSYGRVMPPMVGGILFEHGHRLIAAALSTLVGIQVAVLWWGEPRRSVRRLGFLAFAAILGQAVLGGLTVLLQLPPEVSSAHAALAQIVFALVCVIAWKTSRSGRETSGAVPALPESALPILDLAFRRVLLATAAIYLQIVLGAVMRHTGAGLAIPDFPLAFGGLLPSAAEFGLPGVAIHFAHRLGALLVMVLVARAVSSLGRFDGPMLSGRLGSTWIVLLLAQILLGAFSIYTRKMPALTAAHLAVGALCFVTGVLIALSLADARRAPASSLAPEDGRSFGPRVPA
jgi:cytochrome c oxidase assembly protein subunit 15